MNGQSAIKITGAGILSPAGIGLAESCRTLFEGISPEIEDKSFELAKKLRIQEEWRQKFDLGEKYFLPNLFALMAADEAMSMAGIRPENLVGKRVGICIGSTVGCTNYQEDWGRDFNLGHSPDVTPLFEYFSNNTAQFLARYLGTRGPVMMVSNACTSGADAIGIGASWLQSGDCDIVIAGATEVILPRIFYGFRSLMLTSPDACRPFDRKRSGLSLGEGAGIVILERENAKRAAIAKLFGYGSGSDAFHPTSPHPEARGLGHAVAAAMESANLQLEEVDFVNAHGTGTPHNDLAEGKWLLSHVPQARIVATKGYTGHMLASAGAVEAIFTILSLMDGRLPRSMGFSEVDPEIGLTPTTQIEALDAKLALSVSLGFGGTNAALLLGVGD